MDYVRVDSEVVYVKHILEAHNGEVRLHGDTGWVIFPAPGGNTEFTVFDPVFWHYQFMKDSETREWLRRRRTGEDAGYELSEQEVAWILYKEDNETTFIRFVPDPGAQPLAGTFFYRTGNFVTLAEVFRFGCRTCSCFEMYRTFVNLPIFIHKKAHSQSNTEEGLNRRAAKMLHHQETGRYGLPSWRRRRRP